MKHDDYDRCHWTTFERYIYAQTMRPATRMTTQTGLFRTPRSVFGDFPEVPFDAWLDMPDSEAEQVAAD